MFDGIGASVADLLDTHSLTGASLEATATASCGGRSAHLDSEPSVRPLYREPLRGSTDRASSDWDARLGKFSPAVNHPTQHRPA